MYTYSYEHILFLKKKKKEKRKIICIQILILAIFLITWELLSKYNIINPFLFSSPTKIFTTLNHLIKNDLFYHIWVTLYETIISFSIAFIGGIIIASILWWNKILAKVCDPYLTVINSLPKVALGPLIIIWVGASANSIIFMALMISFIISIINIYNGFISTDQNYITLFKSMKASKLQIFFHIILPCNKETIISSLKINISMSLIGVIMGELLVSKAGLGYLIMYGSQVFNITLVLSSVFVLGILSFLMYYIIYFIEKKLMK